MLLGVIFACGVIIGFMGAAGVHILMSRIVNRDLKSEKNNSTLDSGNVRPERAFKKHVPRANTDLIAYTREIQEQGENRV